MNKNILQGNWKQIKGKVEAEWGKLTKDPSQEALGNIEQFKGYLQKQYGWTEEEAKKKLSNFDKLLDDASGSLKGAEKKLDDLLKK